jgi:hypothetical protein
MAPRPSEPPVVEARPTVWRLTASQIRNSVRDLLGVHALAVELEPETGGGATFSVAARSTPFSARGVEQLGEMARKVAELAFFAPEPPPPPKDPAKARALAAARGGRDRVQSDQRALVPCPPTGRSGDPCVRAYLGGLVTRAFRRPVTNAEIARYAALAESTLPGADPWQGLARAVAAVLQSPSFLYRFEHGLPDPSVPSGARLAGHEIATRLAYFLWNTGPDAGLLADAAAGRLAPGGLLAVVTRMLEDPRARDGVSALASEIYELHLLDGVRKDPTRFPQASFLLFQAMREDVLRTILDVALDRRVDYFESLTTLTAFPNGPLSKVYGQPLPGDQQGPTRIDLRADGPRGGLLTRAAFLTINSKDDVTSPTQRGQFVRQAFLCQTVPPPPPGVDGTLPETPETRAQSRRERLEDHRLDLGCAGCHKLTDPIGFALEGFDPIGRLRTEDDGHPIDTSGDLDGAPFAGARDLERLIRADPRASACLVRQVSRQALGRDLRAGDARLLAELEARFIASGRRLDVLLATIATRPEFLSL